MSDGLVTGLRTKGWIIKPFKRVINNGSANETKILPYSKT